MAKGVQKPVAGSQEAKRGGQATREKYGIEFYRDISRLRNQAAPRARGRRAGLPLEGAAEVMNAGPARQAQARPTRRSTGRKPSQATAGEAKRQLARERQVRLASLPSLMQWNHLAEETPGREEEESNPGKYSKKTQASEGRAMMFDNLDQTTTELVEQIKAACAALAFLREADSPDMLETPPIRAERIRHLNALHLACVALSMAASSLEDQLTHFNELVPGVGLGEEEISLSTEHLGLTSVRSAGRKGGRAIKERYGPSHFQEIGTKGGRTVKERYGSSHYSELGTKGGEALKEQMEPGYYAQIGKRGGNVTKQKHGSEYYSSLGKKGGKATAERGHEYFRSIGQKGGGASRRPRRHDSTPES